MAFLTLSIFPLISLSNRLYFYSGSLWTETSFVAVTTFHDDVIKWKHLPRYWPFVRGIHRSPVNCPHKGQWRGALMFSLICAELNGWVNTREADLRRDRTHYDVIVMNTCSTQSHRPKHHLPTWTRSKKLYCFKQELKFPTKKRHLEIKLCKIFPYFSSPGANELARSGGT